MLIVAHRGLHTHAPENSIAAIRHAIDAGIGHIEVDVRATVDGALVLMHDPTLWRTTNGRGTLRRLSSQDLSSVRLRDGSPVPSLRDALLMCRGRAVLCLDVKEADIAPAVIAEALSVSGAIEFWSAHPSAIETAIAGGVLSCWISPGLFSNRSVGRLAAEARDLGAHALSFFPADLTARTADACLREGIEVMSGTPNDRGTWDLSLIHI